MQNDEQTIKLLKNNPFGENPPEYIRARLFLYEYTSPAERRDTGRWWNREYVHDYLPPQSLKDLQKLGL